MGIDIKGMDKAELLAGLYNASKPLGLGFLEATVTPMTRDDALAIIAEEGLSFDYLNGRVMKIDLAGDTLEPWGYDRDNGQGSAAKIVDTIKTGGTVPTQVNEFGDKLDAFLRAAGPTISKGNQVNLGINEELREALLRVRQNFKAPKTGEDGMN